MPSAGFERTIPAFSWPQTLSFRPNDHRDRQFVGLRRPVERMNKLKNARRRCMGVTYVKITPTDVRTCAGFKWLMIDTVLVISSVAY